MKNLLLIFFLGFALFWVGCEKEEMMISFDKSDASNNMRSAAEAEDCMCASV